MFLIQKKFSIAFKWQFSISLKSGASKFLEDLMCNCFHVLNFQFEKKFPLNIIQKSGHMIPKSTWLYPLYETIDTVHV